MWVLDQGSAFLPQAMGHHTKFDPPCSWMRLFTYHRLAGGQNRTIFMHGATQDCIYQSLEADTFLVGREQVVRDAQDRLLWTD